MNHTNSGSSKFKLVRSLNIAPNVRFFIDLINLTEDGIAFELAKIMLSYARNDVLDFTDKSKPFLLDKEVFFLGSETMFAFEELLDKELGEDLMGEWSKDVNTRNLMRELGLYPQNVKTTGSVYITTRPRGSGHVYTSNLAYLMKFKFDTFTPTYLRKKIKNLEVRLVPLIIANKEVESWTTSWLRLMDFIYQQPNLRVLEIVDRYGDINNHSIVDLIHLKKPYKLFEDYIGLNLEELTLGSLELMNPDAILEDSSPKILDLSKFTKLVKVRVYNTPVILDLDMDHLGKDPGRRKPYKEIILYYLKVQLLNFQIDDNTEFDDLDDLNLSRKYILKRNCILHIYHSSYEHLHHRVMYEYYKHFRIENCLFHEDSIQHLWDNLDYKQLEASSFVYLPGPNVNFRNYLKKVELQKLTNVECLTDVQRITYNDCGITGLRTHERDEEGDITRSYIIQKKNNRFEIINPRGVGYDKIFFIHNITGNIYILKTNAVDSAVLSIKDFIDKGTMPLKVFAKTGKIRYIETKRDLIFIDEDNPKAIPRKKRTTPPRHPTTIILNGLKFQKFTYRNKDDIVKHGLNLIVYKHFSSPKIENASFVNVIYRFVFTDEYSRTLLPNIESSIANHTPQPMNLLQLFTAVKQHWNTSKSSKITDDISIAALYGITERRLKFNKKIFHTIPRMYYNYGPQDVDQGRGKVFDLNKVKSFSVNGNYFEEKSIKVTADKGVLTYLELRGFKDVEVNYRFRVGVGNSIIYKQEYLDRTVRSPLELLHEKDMLTIFRSGLNGSVGRVLFVDEIHDRLNKLYDILQPNSDILNLRINRITIGGLNIRTLRLYREQVDIILKTCESILRKIQDHLAINDYHIQETQLVGFEMAPNKYIKSQLETEIVPYIKSVSPDNGVWSQHVALFRAYYTEEVKILKEKLLKINNIMDHTRFTQNPDYYNYQKDPIFRILNTKNQNVKINIGTTIQKTESDILRDTSYILQIKRRFITSVFFHVHNASNLNIKSEPKWPDRVIYLNGCLTQRFTSSYNESSHVTNIKGFQSFVIRLIDHYRVGGIYTLNITKKLHDLYLSLVHFNKRIFINKYIGIFNFFGVHGNSVTKNLDGVDTVSTNKIYVIDIYYMKIKSYLNFQFEQYRGKKIKELAYFSIARCLRTDLTLDRRFAKFKVLHFYLRNINQLFLKSISHNLNKFKYRIDLQCDFNNNKRFFLLIKDYFKFNMLGNPAVQNKFIYEKRDYFLIHNMKTAELTLEKFYPFASMNLYLNRTHFLSIEYKKKDNNPINIVIYDYLRTLHVLELKDLPAKSVVNLVSGGWYGEIDMSVYVENCPDVTIQPFSPLTIGSKNNLRIQIKMPSLHQNLTSEMNIHSGIGILTSFNMVSEETRIITIPGLTYLDAMDEVDGLGDDDINRDPPQMTCRANFDVIPGISPETRDLERVLEGYYENVGDEEYDEDLMGDESDKIKFVIKNKEDRNIFEQDDDDDEEYTLGVEY